jgi:hypothetical protein
LQAARVPTPRTALGLTPKAALAALDSIGYPALIKPLVGSWGRNVALGAQTRPCEATPEITKLSIDAAAAVGADIAGVDLIEDRDGRLAGAGGQPPGRVRRLPIRARRPGRCRGPHRRTPTGTSATMNWAFTSSGDVTETYAARLLRGMVERACPTRRLSGCLTTWVTGH